LNYVIFTLMSQFKLTSNFKPAGDQPDAINKLVSGLNKQYPDQTLLGVTGSGKTYVMSQVIEKYGRPTLVMAHNKALAAQLAQEYREFFPNNAVHYFVSYYDYYQPEAYVPVTDTYIEKEAQINEEIERLRHASTQALLTRQDVIIVASVSCIYGLGSPEEYEKVNLRLEVGDSWSRKELLRRLVGLYFERTNADLDPGYFRALGNKLEIMPVNERIVYQIILTGGQITDIKVIDPVSHQVEDDGVSSVFIFPAHHFVTPADKIEPIVTSIERELDQRLKELEQEGKNLEAERLKRRTRYDISMIKEVGYCQGIENYSRHFTGRQAGEAPDTLLSYFPRCSDGSPDWLTIIDESHVTLPQIGGMYAGDQARKKTLIEHGFRLPSAKDNRPLTFEEFRERVGPMIYTSATPGSYEYKHSSQVAELVIRPTGLVDPQLIIKPVSECSEDNYPGQVEHFLTEAEEEVKKGGRVLVTTLTKRMAEDLSEYLKERGLNTKYLHSDIKTIERIEILTDFRRGKFDCLVGVNLLREGLDMPEVSLIGIMDADREGFLRSETALIQTIGRAARNVEGRVILYADQVTGSMERAIEETYRRRERQLEHNQRYGITPRTIEKKISSITDSLEKSRYRTAEQLLTMEEGSVQNISKLIKDKEARMEEAVKELDFETAAVLRDELKILYQRQKKNK